MKKVFNFILLVTTLVLVSACGEERIDILKDLNENSIVNIDSLLFKHSYEIDYGTMYNDNRLYDKNLVFNEEIKYFKEDYSQITTTIDEEIYQDSKYHYNNVNIEKFNNYLTNDAYFKKGDKFYYVPLDKLFALDMVSVDPLFIIDEILNNHESYYFKYDDTTVVKDPSLYNKAVFTLSDDVFSGICGNTILKDIMLPYDYEVIAEVKFDKNYRITSIEFDLSDLIKNYSNYLKYEKNINLRKLNMKYSIEISDYEITKPDLPTEYEVLYKDLRHVNFNKSEFNDYNDQIEFGIIDSEVIYNSDTKRYNTSSYIDIEEDMDILYFEVFYFDNDNLLRKTSFQYLDLKKGDKVLIDIYSSNYSITNIYCNMYYSHDLYDDFHNKKVSLDFDYTGPNPQKFNLTDYHETSNEILESIFVTKDKTNDTYDVDFSLRFLKTCRDLDYTLYLVSETGETLIYYLNDANFEDDEVYLRNMKLNFVPVKAYLSLDYNISSINRISKKIDVNVNYFEDQKSFKKYELNTTRAKMTYQSKYNGDFMNNVYTINLETDTYIIDYTGMIYFLDDGEIIDRKLVHSDGNSLQIITKPVYNGQVDEMYICLQTKQGVGIKTGFLGVKGSPAQNN